MASCLPFQLDFNSGKSLMLQCTYSIIFTLDPQWCVMVNRILSLV